MVLDTFLNLLYHGSYLAVFITSFISSSSILIPVLPFPSYFPVLVAVGIGLNPLLAGLVGGFGSALGETIGYFAGLGGSAAIEKFEKKVPRFLKRFEKIYSNMGFWLILICAFLPFPFDIVRRILDSAYCSEIYSSKLNLIYVQTSNRP
ncbi:MAG: hypothetical protein HYW23_04390 [Candidatus Aenigmarchaeota archaeon]|nr:hypothetical protein [Candidatus Aenigmarchaeota archaeon]